MDENDPKPDPKSAGNKPPPRPPYGTAVGIGPEDDDPKKRRRMTVAKVAQGEGKFIRQASGLDHYGHVIIKIEPNCKGGGTEIRDQTTANTIPKEYIKAVVDTLLETLKFSIDGSPIADVVISVIGGSSHKVDSNELAYRMAAIFALKDSLKNAGTIPIG